MLKVLSLFRRTDPRVKIARMRAASERVALVHLEGLAVKGALTRETLNVVARVVHHHPEDLIHMIPDRRRPTRHAKAVACLRRAGLMRNDTMPMREEDYDDEHEQQ